MMVENKILSGAGGGGGGSSASVEPDSLLSDDIVEFTLGLCEGPIAGLLQGPKSFYLDDTPLVSTGDTNNFNPFELHVYHGEAIASPVRNALGGITSNTQVSVALTQDVPVTRVTPSNLQNQIDAIEVRIVFGALVKTTSNGSQVEDTAEFDLEYREVGAPTWTPFFPSAPAAPKVSIKGKTTSGYTKDFVIRLPRVANDWEIRVTKRSPDNDPDRQIVLSWESFQMVTAEDRSYDNLAVVRGLARASDQFSGIPNFSGIYAGKIVRIPTNYDPVTRYYDGVWDGNFQLAFTDNPVWCLYDLITDGVYGLQSHYPYLNVDRYSFYDAAKWCDELVPRPGGGFQPRWTYSDTLDTKRNAMEQLFYICSVIGAIPLTDMNGNLRLKMDVPGTPVQIFGLESVTEEGFNYQFSDITQRINDITVRFKNPELDWEEDLRQVTDTAAIAKNGRIPDEMVAIGCIDVYEAQRRAFRRLIQANTETITVSFQTTRLAMALEVFDLIGISDPTMNWSLSGRVKSQSGSTITLRDPLFVPINTDMTFAIQTPSGVTELTVQSTQASTTSLTITAGTWPVDAPDRAQFALSEINNLGLVKPFRILSIQSNPDNQELLTITALEQNVNKYTDIDTLTSSGTVTYDYREAAYPTAPVIETVESGTNRLFVNPDGTVMARLWLEWSQSVRKFTESFLVEYRPVGEPAFTTIEVRGQEVYISGVEVDRQYELRVRAKNPLGRMSKPSASVFHTVQGKSVNPNSPTNLSASLDGPDVVLDFDAIPDFDLDFYEVYEHTSNLPAPTGATQASFTTTTERYVRTGLPDQVVRFYWVRAVDTSGNRSDWSASTNITTPSAVFSVGGEIGPTAYIDLDGQNVLISEVASGTFDNTTQLLEQTNTLIRVTREAAEREHLLAETALNDAIHSFERREIISQSADTNFASIFNQLTTLSNADISFADELTTLTASLNGNIATTTANLSAISDIDGRLASKISFQADANGEVSLLELYALDDPNAPPISVAKLSADNIILDGSVTATHLDVASLSVAGFAVFGGVVESDNYTEDGNGVPLTGWKLSSTSGEIKGKSVIAGESFQLGAMGRTRFVQYTTTQTVTATTLGTAQLLNLQVDDTEWLNTSLTGATLPATELGDRPLEWIISGRFKAATAPARLLLLLEGFIPGFGWYLAAAESITFNASDAGLLKHFTMQDLTGGLNASLEFYQKLRVSAYVDPAAPYNGNSVEIETIQATFRQLRH